MPGFATRLSETQRWDVINFIRALGAAEGAKTIGRHVELGRAALVAPDFTIAVGPLAPGALRDYRGRRMVLLVLYTLPGSRPRLADLAARYELLVPLGVEIVAVPTDGAPDAIARLGGAPRIFFPVVTDGAPDIVRAYGLFMPGPHAEFLVDRQGYLRALEAAPRGSERLLANVQALNEEKVVVAPPAEHVH
jgi:putative copper resistance protein D